MNYNQILHLTNNKKASVEKKLEKTKRLLDNNETPKRRTTTLWFTCYKLYHKVLAMLTRAFWSIRLFKTSVQVIHTPLTTLKSMLKTSVKPSTPSKSKTHESNNIMFIPSDSKVNHVDPSVNVWQKIY
ncbi:MAG: hypothetical protein U9O89_01535 [Thermoproteota archaeon]|nr:hypothetical protein [Thermoproteota archaeon]